MLERTETATTHATAGPKDRVRIALVLGALGVVFGDIGTSPIYTLQTLFNPDDPHPVPLTPDNVYGVVSLIFWSLMIVVTLTYVSLAMRVDNHGEGGIMALITLVRSWAVTHKARSMAILAALGIFGASLFLGDGVITPAISVLSAVEGLNVVNPAFESWVIPIAAAVLIVLFVAQKFGTHVVGRAFGPIILLWFAAIAACGIGGIALEPTILAALSPTYAFTFLVGHFEFAFFALAAIVLCFTGAEALYADMGHFGRKPISRAWMLVVLPAVTLNYFGQGALVLHDEAAVSSPFFLLIPEWALIPMILLATLATVIASQAVISGAFSVASQAAELGYLPRLRILHTSHDTYGQVYVPWVNWILAGAVLVLVFTFQSSTALAYAYGMTAIGTITITTILFFYVAARTWRAPRWLLWSGAILILAFEVTILAANLTKILHGAWLPLAIALTSFVVMTTWQKGRQVVTDKRTRIEGSLADFIADIHARPEAIATVPGTAIFLNRGKTTVPLALRDNIRHNHVRHESIVIVSVDIAVVPRVPSTHRIVVDDLGDPSDGITHVTINFGYAEVTDVPRALSLVSPKAACGRLNLDEAVFYLSKIELRAGRKPRMASWRKKLFLATSRITVDAAEHFNLPLNRTVVLGEVVEV
ncbi:KUP/HAK/KT family potassium transporter [Microbacterium sp. NEAU-LLB]|uniref:Probable potassium transport system protein Kup n=1 Tax=Microbacterium stercoris TaxID=2820289 RepID=A0A939TXS0_9MICO|nr:KUP/HAK/KT family potassium transporter [Microbacterium stercoris]